MADEDEAETAELTYENAPDIFAKASADMWRHRWDIEIIVGTLLAGTPGDPKIVEGFLRGKVSGKSDDVKVAFLRQHMNQVLQEVGESAALAAGRPMTDDEQFEMLLAETAKKGGEIFKRDPNRDGELYEESRKIAACIKESVSINWPKSEGRPQLMSKRARQWWPEHVYVMGDRVYLGVKEPDEFITRVVHTFDRFGEPQSSFAMHEVIYNARLRFTVASDVPFIDDNWAKIFARAGVQGYGAARSQGFGRFKVIRFDRVGR